MHIRPLTDLAGNRIVAWVGEEMALSEAFDEGQILWQHASVPFMQFISLDAQLGDGEVFTLLSQLDDSSGFYGLYSPAAEQPRLSEKPHIPGSIYRTRSISEMPVGRITACDVIADESGNITDLYLEIENKTVRIASGEVYEMEDYKFRIVFIDESLLVQVQD